MPVPIRPRGTVARPTPRAVSSPSPARREIRISGATLPRPVRAPNQALACSIRSARFPAPLPRAHHFLPARPRARRHRPPPCRSRPAPAPQLREASPPPSRRLLPELPLSRGSGCTPSPETSRTAGAPPCPCPSAPILKSPHAASASFSSPYGSNVHQLRCASLHPHRVAQRPSEAFESHLHYVPVAKLNAVSKAQAIGAEKMHVQVPGPAVRIEFEVVMLDIPQAVAHFRLARANLLPPQHARIALDHHLARHRLKIRVEHELGPDRTGANLRTRQVQIILLLELMIGKLVSGGHAHAPRHSRRIRKIDAGDFALFAAIFRVRGSFQGFAMRAQDRTRSFIEPFRRCANLPGRWAPSLDSPAKHLHAVGQVLVFRVHGLPFARTAQMRQARAGDEAPRRFAGMIHRRKQPPWRSAAINRVVIQQLLGDLSLRERAERQVRCKRLFHQRIHRFAIAQQAQPRLLYNCHAPRVLISNLHKPHHAFRLTRSPRSLRAPSHSRAIPAPAYCRQAPRTHSAPSVRPRRCTRKVRCLPPRPRSENIQPSASSGSPSRRGNCASARHGGSPARNTIRRARRFCALA